MIFGLLLPPKHDNCSFVSQLLWQAPACRSRPDGVAGELYKIGQKVYFGSGSVAMLLYGFKNFNEL